MHNNVVMTGWQYASNRMLRCSLSQDSGVRAFVSGLVVASSEVMLGSSLNDPDCKRLPEASKCQKPFSGYIELITEWRENVVGKSAGSVVRLFPFEDEECEAYEEPKGGKK